MNALCAHDMSLTGAEGPVADLGRWPVLWTCDECDEIVIDISTETLFVSSVQQSSSQAGLSSFRYRLLDRQ